MMILLLSLALGLFSHSATAAGIAAGVTYQYDVVPQGIIEAPCGAGTDLLSLTPMAGAAANYRTLYAKARLCTTFGVKDGDVTLNLPAEALGPDYPFQLRLGESRSYPGIPSLKTQGALMTVRITRLDATRLQVEFIPPNGVDPDSTPVQIAVGSPQELSGRPGWRPGMLPWKWVHFTYSYSSFFSPMVIEGNLDRVDSTALMWGPAWRFRAGWRFWTPERR